MGRIAGNEEIGSRRVTANQAVAAAFSHECEDTRGEAVRFRALPGLSPELFSPAFAAARSDRTRSWSSSALELRGRSAAPGRSVVRPPIDSSLPWIPSGYRMSHSTVERRSLTTAAVIWWPAYPLGGRLRRLWSFWTKCWGAVSDVVEKRGGVVSDLFNES